VKPKSSAVSRAYTFIDCVREFAPFFKSIDLSAAYKRAGPVFSGVLSRFFVVLDDEHSKTVQKRTRPKRQHPDSHSDFAGKRQK